MEIKLAFVTPEPEQSAPDEEAWGAPRRQILLILGSASRDARLEGEAADASRRTLRRAPQHEAAPRCASFLQPEGYA